MKVESIKKRAITYVTKFIVIMIIAISTDITAYANSGIVIKEYTLEDLVDENMSVLYDKDKLKTSGQVLLCKNPNDKNPVILNVLDPDMSFYSDYTIVGFKKLNKLYICEDMYYNIISSPIAEEWREHVIFKCKVLIVAFVISVAIGYIVYKIIDIYDSLKYQFR